MISICSNSMTRYLFIVKLKTNKMKKLQKSYRLLLLSTLLGSLLLTGCINSDYKFDKIDYTLGIGGDEITLPGNNSTKEILLDDLLDINNSDFITTEVNGDYKLFKKPDNPIAPVKVNIDHIVISSNKSLGLSYDINLPAFPAELQGQKIVLPYTPPIPGASPIDIPELNGIISLLDYEFDADPAIKSLEYVEVGIDGQGVNLIVDLNIPSDINRCANMKIDFPDMLTMTCPSMEDKFDKQKNELTLTNHVNMGHEQIVFNVTRINVKSIDENNYAKFENGKFLLKASVGLGVKISEITIPSTNKLTISGTAQLDDVIITKVRGTFDPQINLDDVGTVKINSLPDFLTEEEVVADIDNPQIWLTIYSTMPLGGTIKAQLTSDTHPTPILLDPIQVAASTDGVNPSITRLVICRHAPTALTGYTPMIVEGLSELIEKLKEPMEIKFTVSEAKATQTPATVKLGYNYELAPEYRFECPLAFGDKATIVYSRTERDWHKDIDKLQLAPNAYVYVTGTAVNKIPADLELDIKPLDVNEQELSADVINVELIKKEVAGTKGAALESPLEVKISGDISRLDGIKMKLKAKSNESLKGVTLNKSSQTLLLKDVTVKLVGKLIYNAN